LVLNQGGEPNRNGLNERLRAKRRGGWSECNGHDRSVSTWRDRVQVETDDSKMLKINAYYATDIYIAKVPFMIDNVSVRHRVLAGNRMPDADRFERLLRGKGWRHALSLLLEMRRSSWL